MTLRIANRVVVFDCGEVISLEPNPADRDALAAVHHFVGASGLRKVRTDLAQTELAR